MRQCSEKAKLYLPLKDVTLINDLDTSPEMPQHRTNSSAFINSLMTLSLTSAHFDILNWFRLDEGARLVARHTTFEVTPYEVISAYCSWFNELSAKHVSRTNNFTIFGDIAWPLGSPDLTAADYFLWGYLKSRVYRNKPRTIIQLEQNIRNEISAIESVLKEWTRSKRSRAVTLREEGYTFKEIARKLGNGATVSGVQKVWQRYKSTKSCKRTSRTGRKPKVSPRDVRQICGLALKDRKKSSKEIQEVLHCSGLGISARTV
ncbi:hypothetical protein ANN_03047 [Periplaneta americana]|uniref:Uncharacterized protein n=1 Tax=Periplaneta americana TaxID=6978 RepID=A0ABQ8U0J8_PERAM|nr:hypothetical protein ANN_03047 [Periplaneta americana]